MNSRAKQSVAALLALSTVVIAVVVTTAAASSGHHHANLRPAVHHHATSARLQSLFAVFRHSIAHTATANDQPLPSAAIEGLSHKPGMEPDAALYVGGTYPTWLVPGSAEACIVVAPNRPHAVPGGTCAPVSTLNAGMTLITEGPSGQPLIIGLVPNGNASVGVTDVDGSTRTVAVTNNMFEINTGDPNTVTLKDASGASATHMVRLSPTPPPSAPATATP